MCQIMFYLFFWTSKDRKFFPVTKYYGLSQFMFAYFIVRAFLNYVEFSGTNICIRREIFEKVGGFIPVPNSKGIDAIFSSALRKFCRPIKSHIKMINSMAVLTNPRFITRKRIVNRIQQHRRIAKYYQKLSNTKINMKAK